ncbi:MAG: glutathione peroxidase [Fimbriiglobus sp.]|jgi:glutathione peroxidase|nr:glutathione peroxidase [Fimbriiglobus sp.]
MTRFALAVMAMAFAACGFAADKKEEKKVTSPLDFKLTDIDGKDVDLSQYKGKVVLLVNVASQCGLTPQYTALQKLYAEHEKEGLVVIGVPANEFGKQEPGTNAEIKEFCSAKYKVTFPMLGKVVVKGDGITPLYKFLTDKETNPKFAGPITWNFEKFLINKKGEVVNRFSPRIAPDADEVTKAIKAELAAK